MKLKLTYTTLFGRNTYYPNCDNSRFICNLCGVKSLSTRQVNIVAKAGWPLDIRKASDGERIKVVK